VFDIRRRDKDDLKRLAELVSHDLAKRPVVHEYDLQRLPVSRLSPHAAGHGFVDGEACRADRLRQFQELDRFNTAPKVEEQGIPWWGFGDCFEDLTARFVHR
jgi:hypothetical protein